MKVLMLLNKPIPYAERLLASNDRNMEWAHELCTVSRFVHVHVWLYCVDLRTVEADVIPLLQRISTALAEFGERSTSLSDDDRKHIREYMENDERRIVNIRSNYLKGRRSAFLPEETFDMLHTEKRTA